MGRTVAQDILYISCSITAGTAISALTLPLCHTSGLVWIMAALELALAGVATGVFAVSGRSRIGAVPLFVMLGMACHAAANAGCISEFASIGTWRPAELASERLKAGIASLPFRYEETKPLLTALLTGSRESLSPEITAWFRASGASHILALSGLHLGVIYGIMNRVLSVIGRSRTASLLRSAIIAASCTFYAILTGCSPSIVRALLFIFLNELSGHSPGRRKSPLAILSAALTIQLVISPSVITNIGFQLSYLAMLGIFLIYPVLKEWYPSSGRRAADVLDPMRKIWNSAAMSLSCQIFTAPLVWKRFGSVPGHFLLTNLLALPLVEVLIISALASLTAGAFGNCPDLMIRCTDTMARALVFILEVISSM